MFKVIKENILQANDAVADVLREALRAKATLMLNLISSPGAGKTSFLEVTAPALQEKGLAVGIIVGDCYTSKDAQRIDCLGVPVVQINTGNACHIDAQLVYDAYQELADRNLDIIFVENVGNLVCPAEFDVGEDMKVALLSVPEGHDKPSKYPLLIQESALAIINKIDMIKYTNFEISVCREDIARLNPAITIVEISCQTGAGIADCMQWIETNIYRKKETRL